MLQGDVRFGQRVTCRNGFAEVEAACGDQRVEVRAVGAVGAERARYGLFTPDEGHERRQKCPPRPYTHDHRPAALAQAVQRLLDGLGQTDQLQLAGKKVPVKLAPAGRASARRKATARPRVKCPSTAIVACAGRVVLKAQKKRPGGGKKLVRLGRATYEVEPGTKQRIAVKVKKKARKLLVRKRRTKGRASLVGEQTRTKRVTFVRKR